MPIKPSLKLAALGLGGLVVTVVIVLVLLYILRAWWTTPIFGFGASGPDQPIAFPHTVHVEEAGNPVRVLSPQRDQGRLG